MVQGGEADTFADAVPPDGLAFGPASGVWLTQNATLQQCQKLEAVAGLASFKRGSILGNQ
jgi:hypothetical protein